MPKPEVFEEVLSLRRQGEYALRGYAYGTALGLFGEALAMWPLADVTGIADLIQELLQAARLGGEQSRGLEIVTGLEARLANEVSGGYLFLAEGRLNGYLDKYEGRTEALERARRSFIRWENPHGLGTVLSELAYPAGRSLSLAQKIEYGEEGLRIAAGLPDQYLQSYCAANLACVRHPNGDWRTALQLLEEARGKLDLAHLRDRNEYVRQSFLMAAFAQSVGKEGLCARAIAEARQVADDDFWNRILDLADGLSRWRAGSWKAAVPYLESAAAGAAPTILRIADVILQLIALERGDPPDMALVERATSLLVEHEDDMWAGFGLALAVQLRTWRREPSPARGVRGYAEEIRSVGFRFGWAELLPAAAEADARTYQQLVDTLGEIRPVGPHADAAVLFGEGIELARRGSADDAGQRLAAAADGFAGANDPYLEARARDALSRVHDSRDAARREATRSAEIYSDIGAQRSLARLVRRSRGRGLLTKRRVPENLRGKGAPGLTAREQEVANLSAAGYTIAEIAGELSISIGTVRKHLEHIRGKLGLARKTDLVRLTHEP